MLLLTPTRGLGRLGRAAETERHGPRCWLAVVLEEAVVGVRGEALRGKMRKRSGKGAWLP